LTGEIKEISGRLFGGFWKMFSSRPDCTKAASDKARHSLEEYINLLILLGRKSLSNKKIRGYRDDQTNGISALTPLFAYVQHTCTITITLFISLFSGFNAENLAFS